MKTLRIALLLPLLAAFVASVNPSRIAGQEKVDEEKIVDKRAVTEPGELDRVEIASGIIEGLGWKDGVRIFRGIPFAEPPVGELRWKPPQPVKPWQGVRKADKFGPPPMQGALAKLVFGVSPSEDSLYLNVWTAAKDSTERRPVMVYIYGGAFNGGGTGDALTDGANLAKKGVVLVNFNHRVGVFGFLAHPELSRESGKGSGCYGIQDQIAALRWVQKNIAEFGGDPGRVTVFGQSSGGTSVSILTQSPLAAGLFQRAICQSGGAMAPIKSTLEESPGLIQSLPLAEEQGKKFLASLGVKDIKAARALSADAVMKGNAGGLLGQLCRERRSERAWLAGVARLRCQRNESDDLRQVAAGWRDAELRNATGLRGILGTAAGAAIEVKQEEDGFQDAPPTL